MRRNGTTGRGWCFHGMDYNRMWDEMQLLPGCCSSIESLKYDIARGVTEKLWKNTWITMFSKL